MKKNLEQQERELEERVRAFEHERDAWEEQNKQFDSDQSVPPRSLALLNFFSTQFYLPLIRFSLYSVGNNLE